MTIAEKRHLFIRGMHGLGDNLHQRAIIRQLMPRFDVYLESSWIAPYHDLIAGGLKVLHKRTSLRTQAKNADRERNLFWRGSVPIARQMQISYSPDLVRECGSVLAAMCRTADVDYARADFRLPIPAEWRERADRLIDFWQPTKPILIYRPLNERTEWGGCQARNPDYDAYASLFASIRDQFFVVSVADLVPKKEWMVGHPIKADVECHSGELDFETLVALASRSAMVYSSPGFAVILAQAVGTPVACIFGGYEDSTSFAGGARYSPYLGIDPIKPCQCFSHKHDCQKEIDIGAATELLQSFVTANTGRLAG
ncbi:MULTISPECIES: hypothetical protein [unclassified Mesorhizobium]|uniref:hypothetical protein n=1 Tax=unclassified Mesorhizobium TaxID=325217 RepID=UPI00112CD8C4|nr:MULTISPECIES: hypothetical protein [unclassified Mesorhizobium]TPJ86952.1 hypothetical protein FJ489_30860 [Mesorhizobium sp. B2-5-12]TPK19175.1 hypothetical protein FJ562_31265 [Mesorhizobium sp. B2-5-6]